MMQLFGILGSGKQQVAYSKVTVNVVDVRTSEVVHSVQGAGEYVLSNREVLGFWRRGRLRLHPEWQSLDLAIREAINRLVESVEQGKWKPARNAR